MIRMLHQRLFSFREIDLDLVEPTGVDRSVDEDRVGRRAAQRRPEATECYACSTIAFKRRDRQPVR